MDLVLPIRAERRCCVSVKAILKTKGNAVITAGPTDTLQRIARLIAEYRIGAVVIVDGAKHPVGIVSERDIVNALASYGAHALELPAERVMSRNLLTCEMASTPDELLGIMTNSRVRHLPVVEEGRLIGIVSIGDVVKRKLDDASAEVGMLRDYVMAGR